MPQNLLVFVFTKCLIFCSKTTYNKLVSSFILLQDDIAEEAETGKIYRADYKDKHGRTVLVLRPGLEVSLDTGDKISGNN